MSHEQLYRAYSCGAMSFDELKSKLQECDCETLGKEIHTDDLGCMVKPCVECGKTWFTCGFCKRQDFETEEELTEHVSERHPDLLDEGSMFAPDGDGPDD